MFKRRIPKSFESCSEIARSICGEPRWVGWAAPHPVFFCPRHDGLALVVFEEENSWFCAGCGGSTGGGPDELAEFLGAAS